METGLVISVHSVCVCSSSTGNGISRRDQAGARRGRSWYEDRISDFAGCLATTVVCLHCRRMALLATCCVFVPLDQKILQHEVFCDNLPRSIPHAQ